MGTSEAWDYTMVVLKRGTPCFVCLTVDTCPVRDAIVTGVVLSFGM